MASELQYQTHLVEAANRMGFGFKMSNRFLAGIPDLFLQVTGKPTLVVEIKKWTSLPKLPVTPIESGLTPLQRQTLLDMLKAGTKCGWLAIYREGTTDYLFASPDPKHNPTRAEFHQFAVIRKRGTPWTEVLLPALAPLFVNTSNSY